MCQIAVNFRFFMPFNFGWKAYFSARGRGVDFCFSARGRGMDFCFSARGRGVGLSAQLAYKSSCFFENWGTRDQQSAFLAHFTYKSLLWQRKTGTKVGSKVI